MGTLVTLTFWRETPPKFPEGMASSGLRRPALGFLPPRARSCAPRSWRSWRTTWPTRRRRPNPRRADERWRLVCNGKLGLKIGESFCLCNSASNYTAKGGTGNTKGKLEHQNAMYGFFSFQFRFRSPTQEGEVGGCKSQRFVSEQETPPRKNGTFPSNSAFRSHRTREAGGGGSVSPVLRQIRACVLSGRGARERRRRGIRICRPNGEKAAGVVGALCQGNVGTFSFCQLIGFPVNR